MQCFCVKTANVNCCETTGSPGRPLTHFRSHEVSNTTTLLLSEDGDMLYVGARDAVLALDVGHRDTMTLRSKVREPALMVLQAQPLLRESQVIKGNFKHKCVLTAVGK